MKIARGDAARPPRAVEPIAGPLAAAGSEMLRSNGKAFELPGVLWRRDPHGDRLPLVLDSPHSGSVYPDDFGFCCPLPLLRRAEDAYVDELYECAKDAGATGAKLLGAGTSGFFLVVAPLDCQPTVRANLGHLREVPFRFASRGNHIPLFEPDGS